MIEFGRAVCGDLAQAERREWLVTNGLGSFASGTIAGTLTRRYHGLLIAAFRPPTERTLLATKIDEVATYRESAYALAANRWRSEYLAPTGFTHIERFYLDGTMPVWEYALADALIEKRVWMEPGANVTYVRYRALRASGNIALALRLFTNYRSFHGNTHAGEWHVEVSAPGAQTLRVDALADGRPLFVVADAGAFEVENVWYRDFVLTCETQRGLDDRDDHLAAGSVNVALQPHGSVTIAFGLDVPPAFESAAALERRRAYEAHVLDAAGAEHPADAPMWLRRCALAADQFVVAHPIASDPDARSILAGYHWFGDWGRDATIALCGLTLMTGRSDVARSVLTTYASFVDDGMLPNAFPDDAGTPQYNTVDAALWYVEAAARYVAHTSDEATLRRIFPSLQSIVAHYRDGTRYGIHMDADGLIVASAPGLQLTWMDAKVGDWVVTPRMGKPVEIAALWYNALLRMRDLAAILGEDGSGYAELAHVTRRGFERFWNSATGYCYDVLDGPDGDDASLRPNQLFAVALAHATLDLERARGVVDACAAQLVTSHGMRSLAPEDARFNSHYLGSPAQRDAAYHQGTAWAWLLGPFAIAHARVYRDASAARSFLRPLADTLFDGGLGTIGEIADGAEPYALRGAIAQAWSVGELLRAWHDIPSAARNGLA